MKEDKQKILNLLLPALQETRNLEDLMSLVYIKLENGEERVIAIFPAGDKGVNVTGDSGTSMIQDVLRGII
jgi:hypothetical protein